MRGLVLLTLLTVWAIQDAAADPKSHYMIHCMGCHLADGSGKPPDVPAFDGQLGQFVETEAGRAYLVRVPGAAQSLINNEDLAAVINWMLYRYSMKTLPADFQPFTTEEVARHRIDILAKPIVLRKALLAH